MSWTRRFIWAFWICLGVLICWNLYSCNDKIEKTAAAQAKPDHYFFYQPTHTDAVAATAVHESAYVEQTKFTVEDNTPSESAFTCHVTLKNTGQTKATSVEVCVRPFRGTLDGSEDNGPNVNKPLADDSPRAQINQWVAFPDLAPGESSTQSVVFVKDGPSSNYGENPRAEITFLPEKK